MSHLDKPHSHPICPTCQSDLSDKQRLDYLAGGTALPPENDAVFKLYEESARLMYFLGALAQAGPLAIAQYMDERKEAPDWMYDFVGLAEELTNETERRLLLLRNAGRIWEERVTARKEG